MKRNVLVRLSLLLITLLVVAACGAQPVELTTGVPNLPEQGSRRTVEVAPQSEQSQPSSATSATQSGHTQAGEAHAAPVSQTAETVAFTLQTTMEGALAFKGVGGDIDGVLNPELRVPAGATVEITLINGDGMLHDLVVEAFGAATTQFSDQGESQTITFVANRTGTFDYFCSVPGHRQAGMAGKIIVEGEIEGEQMAQEPVNPYTSDSPEVVAHPPAVADAPVISADPNVVPEPVGDREPQTIRIDLETTEVVGQLANGTTYEYWTFNGTVPGPMLRVRVGDTIELHMVNHEDSKFAHSIDFHAMTGYHGGGSLSQAAPGEEKVFTWTALQPGVYVYHCATPMVPHHIANGMYGLIVVEPEGGLPPVDREFYVMQGEIYTTGEPGDTGHLDFDVDAMLDENPNYIVFNGSTQALAGDMALRANVGETVRIYMGVGGPNQTSSFHVIGEIFERVYSEGSITSPPLTDVQTTIVPPGGATMVEFTVEQPGHYVLVDHALGRLVKGLSGLLIVEGPENPDVSHEGPAQ